MQITCAPPIPAGTRRVCASFQNGSTLDCHRADTWPNDASRSTFSIPRHAATRKRAPANTAPEGVAPRRTREQMDTPCRSHSSGCEPPSYQRGDWIRTPECLHSCSAPVVHQQCHLLVTYVTRSTSCSQTAAPSQSHVSGPGNSSRSRCFAAWRHLSSVWQALVSAAGVSRRRRRQSNARGNVRPLFYTPSSFTPCGR
jgi:hypothetical protein